MSAGKIALGAVIGMATGAVLGVLFAPHKGSATRKQLSKQGSRYIGTLKGTANDYVNTLEEKFEGLKENAVGIKDKVRDAVDSIAGQ